MRITIRKEDYDEVVHGIIAHRSSESYEELTTAAGLLAKLEALGAPEEKLDAAGRPEPTPTDAPFFMGEESAEIDVTDDELRVLRVRIERELRRRSTKRLARLLPTLGPVAEAGDDLVARKNAELEALEARIVSAREELQAETVAARDELTAVRNEVARARAQVVEANEDLANARRAVTAERAAAERAGG